MYQELTGIKKPFLDKDNILHWPVVFLYPEAMSSDIIEDFCETDIFTMHLDTISFSKLDIPYGLVPACIMLTFLETIANH